jgi:hypothetical protein
MQQVKKTHKLFLKLISLLIKSFILNQFMQVFSFYIIYGRVFQHWWRKILVDFQITQSTSNPVNQSISRSFSIVCKSDK